MIKILNKEHKTFFSEMLEKTGCASDPYRAALFYTLGLTDDTRRRVDKLYDFEDKSIRTEAAFKGAWHTSSSLKVVRLAFNLYNGYFKKNSDDFTPYELFDCGELREYFFEAVRIRYEAVNLFE